MQWTTLIFVLLATLTILLGCQKNSRLAATAQGPITLRLAAAPHGLIIGTAASAVHLSDTQYAAILGSEFGELEPENEMKFENIHPRPDTDPNPYDFRSADKLVAFARSNRMIVRGHALVWHNQLPTWLMKGGFSAGQLSVILQKHISAVVRHYGPQVYAWDVVNEAFNDDGTMHENIWYDLPGIGFAGQGTKYIEQALTWAHTADPDAQLFYNGNGAEIINAKSDAIFAMARDFKQRGVPLNGIGFEMHLDLSFDDRDALASLSSNLQRFAALGLKIHITEMDVRLPNAGPDSLTSQADLHPLNLQADLYQKITAICLRVSSCKVLQTWGLTDRYSWIPWFYPNYDRALLWDANYQKKPAYNAVLRVLGEKP